MRMHFLKHHGMKPTAHSQLDPAAQSKDPVPVYRSGEAYRKKSQSRPDTENRCLTSPELPQHHAFHVTAAMIPQARETA